jgi:NADH dehydrogenase FAD-containing subunit
MNKFLSNNFSRLTYINRRYFSTKHSKLIVIGAGTGGLSVSGQLRNQKVYNANDITIFDPAKTHFYQPGFTKIAGGVIENDYVINNYVKYDMRELVEAYNFKNEGVKTISPENNSVTTESGETWTYDNLVIASGLRLKKDSIPGIKTKSNNFYKIFRP